jgi:putative ABC transport system permease protein
VTVWTDVRLAARLLLKDRGFTLPAIVALALGIGANAVVFTIVNAAFLRDLPFRDPDRVVVLGIRNTASSRVSSNVSQAEFDDWRSAARTFDGLASFAERPMNLADEASAAEQVSGAYVSASAFDLLGYVPTLGRGFTADDDRPGAEPVAILGQAIWRARYQAAAEVVGRTIRVNGVQARVIGVMPERFEFPDRAQLWLPMTQLAVGPGDPRAQRTMTAIGRLASGVTTEEAQADLAVVGARLAKQFPATNANIQPLVEPYRERNLTRPLRIVLSLLTGAVVFVLLIGCANVANLLLARSAGREREVSLRMSMGASRGLIVRQLLIESLLLALVAGALGLIVSGFAVRAFALAVGGAIPFWLDFTMDWRVFAFFAAVCLGTSLLFGLLPAAYTSRTNLVRVLNEVGRGSSSGPRTRRWTAALVTGQLAMTLMLLTGAGLMVRGVMMYFQTDTGIDTAGVMLLRVTLSGSRYDAADQRRAFYGQLETGLAGTPGMQATFASAVPRMGAPGVTLSIDGRANSNPEPVLSVLVGAGYFGALGIRVLQGRDFDVTDGAPGREAVVVNEQLAAQYFPNESPLGQRIRTVTRGSNTVESPWATIVGVVKNVRQMPRGDGFDPVVYSPYAASPSPAATILARSNRGTAAVVSEIRALVARLDPDLPLFDLMTLDDRLATGVVERQIFGTMLGMFAAIALVLAGVGLYSVIAYSVSQTTREIGIRIALGAQAKQVYWLVSRTAAWQIAVGLAIGLLGSVGVGIVLQNLQSEVRPVDPLTFVFVVGTLIVVSLVACLIPAHRATRLDPVAALRSE